MMAASDAEQVSIERIAPFEDNEFPASAPESAVAIVRLCEILSREHPAACVLELSLPPTAPLLNSIRAWASDLLRIRTARTPLPAGVLWLLQDLREEPERARVRFGVYDAAASWEGSPMPEYRCPACGTPVRVHRADEGTQSYTPLAPCPGPERCGVCGAEPAPSSIRAAIEGALHSTSWHHRKILSAALEPTVRELVRAGQERMRERAAHRAEATDVIHGRKVAHGIAELIRELPLEEE
jgi:hypothetical protein